MNWTATWLLFSKDFFHRTPLCIFAVIVNRLCTVFLKINQGWWRWRGDFYPLSPPLLISRNNSEMVKAVTLAFCSIIPNSPQSQDIWQNSDGDISDFRISGQSFIKRQCHNSRTSDDIDMKLGPVIKLDKRNKKTSKYLTMTSFQ